MKELHRKDPASHSGPELCDADREDCSEALTGEDAGEVLSHEIREPVMPTPLSEAEGNSPQIDKARDVGKRRGRRPSACEETSWNGTGRGTTATTWHRCVGGEDSSIGTMRSAQCHIRNRFCGFLIWIPTRTQSASGTRRDR